MWITVDVERVLRVDRGINVILCNPMLGSGGPQTLVLKLKGSEMTDEVQRLRSALESIADWRNVNISGEYEHGLRDIIRSIVDCAVAALDSPTQRPASQAAPTREEFLPRDAWNELVHKDDRTSPDDYPDMCLISIDELKDYMERHTRPAPQAALDSIPPHLNYLIGRGKTRPDEPLYGVQILDGLKIVAQTENDDLIAAIREAVSSLSRPQPKCDPSTKM